MFIHINASEIIALVLEDLSLALGLPQGQITVLGISEGSLIVRFNVERNVSQGLSNADVMRLIVDHGLPRVVAAYLRLFANETDLVPMINGLQFVAQAAPASAICASTCIGLIVGGVLFLAAISSLVVWLCRRRHRKTSHKEAAAGSLTPEAPAEIILVNPIHSSLPHPPNYATIHPPAQQKSRDHDDWCGSEKVLRDSEEPIIVEDYDGIFDGFIGEESERARVSLTLSNGSRQPTAVNDRGAIVVIVSDSSSVLEEADTAESCNQSDGTESYGSRRPFRSPVCAEEGGESAVRCTPARYVFPPFAPQTTAENDTNNTSFTWVYEEEGVEFVEEEEEEGEEEGEKRDHAAPPPSRDQPQRHT